MPALTCSHRSGVDFRRQSVPASKIRKRRGQLMSAWVRNGVLMGADELVAELGGDLTALRREVGLEPLDDPDFPIPALAVVEFLERAASVCACEAFGLLLSQKQDFSIFGPLWPFLRSASTVGEVLHDLAEFFPVHTQGALVVVEKTPDGAVLRYDLAAGVRTGQWQLPSRRANQGSCGPRPLHQCAGKESSRLSLNANSTVLQIAVRSSQ